MTSPNFQHATPKTKLKIKCWRQEEDDDEFQNKNSGNVLIMIENKYESTQNQLMKKINKTKTEQNV